MKVKTILLVMDQAAEVLVEEKSLRAEGYDVVTAGDGDEALRAIDGNDGTVDLVLMDSALGGGKAASRTAARILERVDLPLLFLAGADAEKVVAETEQVPAYGYVAKATAGAILSASIKAALRLRGELARRTPPEANEAGLGSAAESRLKTAIEEKELLLQELQHRVKNNLAVVTGLLNIGMSECSEESGKRVIMEALTRIRSMTMIYDQLTKTSGLNRVNLQPYLSDLTRYLYAAYDVDEEAVSLKIEVQETDIDLVRAIPIGLILNELITNSLKYAFPGGAKGSVSVEVIQTEGMINMIVCDDGIGFPEGFDWRYAETMGLKLVRLLADQIDGWLTVESGPGVRVVVTLKE